MEENQQYQMQGVQWLYEMELLNHPQLINNLKLNILMISPKIKEVELLLSRPHKQIMIYVKLGWFARKFSFSTLEGEILDVMSQLLPSYQFRVIHDKSILNLAIEKLEASIQGVQNESTSITKSDDVSTNSPSGQLPDSSNILPDQEEQTSDERSKSDDAIKSDI